MKQLLLSLATLFLTLMVCGQAQEGLVDYQKTSKRAAVIELPYSPDIVNAAMSDYLSKKGRSRGTDLKGFTTFRNTQLLQSDTANADLYFKVERKSRKESDISVVSLLLSSPKESVAVDNMHYLNMDQAKNYLNDLVPAIETYSLELQIKKQNEAVIKAESRYKSLVDNGTDLEKNRVNLEKKIQENKVDQQNQTSEVENQKQKLSVLVSQRKS